MRWRIEFQERKLDDLFNLFQSVQDEELKAYLAKFLCIRASGFIETSFKNLINDYINGTCPKPIQKFVSMKVKGVTNLNYERLHTTIKSLHSEWATDFEAITTEEQRSALNSVISNRNNISHGENDSISYELMRGYYKSIKEIVGHLKQIIRK
jgi:hypothetical protein